MNVFIGGAWPYANGSLHIGHIVALLPGDVIARYYRKKEIMYFMYQVVTVMEHQYQLEPSQKELLQRK
ncbi:methionine--tRNA ligase 1 [[Clostridium] sordellii]|nr:class I tRNA ligase family protein [Paeniclostridium sordellii]CEO08249.1 methionine--tRNA ligase 1 [[Clostridium] sordellii] [Paeniclostridium sordellii]CEO34732.1 methionine--tRNA ligase 1 [[Clostridium] sordellii] [Paeniclostridium sordellii]CEP87145.1 methionine--tRNA ligase 1 [[Clostridium] sordellii] [Paeniclostridium sordellii]CEP95482.1 methionine--tRNA ligase 1 [[Clostridium] sordellii] [Paeniclostridium sordellii]CEP99178.1 methionine--tRNA ligase 1 [[Clostridium] sordellii] [Paen